MGAADIALIVGWRIERWVVMIQRLKMHCSRASAVLVLEVRGIL